mgnify:CR=1 FL=1
MGHGGKRKNAGRRPGGRNKTTREIREIIQETVDFPELVKKLEARAGGKSDLAARLLFEYGYGKSRDMDLNVNPGTAEEITRSFAEVVRSAGAGKATSGNKSI